MFYSYPINFFEYYYYYYLHKNAAGDVDFGNLDHLGIHFPGYGVRGLGLLRFGARVFAGDAVSGSGGEEVLPILFS